MKIAVLSGKRGGYDAMVPLMEEIEKYKHDLLLILCDMHTTEGSGHSEIEIPFKNIIEVPPKLITIPDTSENRAWLLGGYIGDFSGILEKNKPDLVVIYGDRGEALAMATACIQMNIPYAHLQGGDMTGCVDQKFRYMISCGATLSFVASVTHYKNVCHYSLAAPQTVLVTGDNHIDSLYKGIALDKKVTNSKHIPFIADTKPILIIMHPDTLQPDKAQEHINAVVDACMKFSLEKVIVFPCSDPGNKAIINAIRSRCKGNQWHTFKNLPSSTFLKILKNSMCLIGNSSSGIIEANYLGTPSVNIGDRQNGRICPKSVVQCPSVDAGSIFIAMHEAMQKPKVAKEFKYGVGKAAEVQVKYMEDWFSGRSFNEKRI